MITESQCESGNAQMRQDRRRVFSANDFSDDAERTHVEWSRLAVRRLRPRLIPEPLSGGPNTRAWNVSFGVCRTTEPTES